MTVKSSAFVFTYTNSVRSHLKRHPERPIVILSAAKAPIIWSGKQSDEES